MFIFKTSAVFFVASCDEQLFSLNILKTFVWFMLSFWRKIKQS